MWSSPMRSLRKAIRGRALKIKKHCGRYDGYGTSVAEHPRRQGSQWMSSSIVLQHGSLRRSRKYVSLQQLREMCDNLPHLPSYIYKPYASKFKIHFEPKLGLQVQYANRIYRIQSKCLSFVFHEIGVLLFAVICCNFWATVSQILVEPAVTRSVRRTRWSLP